MITPDVPGAAEYISGTRSFLAGLRPQHAVGLPLSDALDLMHRRFGDAVEVAMSPQAIDMRTPLDVLPHQVHSPRANETDSSWMRNTNMVGVNVRTVGD